MSESAKIHPSADVSTHADVGPGVRIWQHCVVLGGAKIGEHTQLSTNVFVEGRVRIGRNVKVKNNVALYDGVVLEDDVFVGPSAVFTNVLTPRSRWPRKQGFRDTVVRRGASIGANATIVCGVTIGDFALVGAGAVVTRDVPAFAVVTGSPAKLTGYACQCGLPLRSAAHAPAGSEIACTDCGSTYRRTAAGLDAMKLTDAPALGASVQHAGKRLVFRADASPELGIGHVQRCLTLADALSRRGWEIGFACRRETHDLVPALRSAGIRTAFLPDNLPGEFEAMRTSWPEGVTWLVVDHYDLDADYERAARGWARKVAAIGDMPSRPHAVDVLLDPNLGRRGSDYQGLLEPQTNVLAGADYILLRPDIAAQPRRQGSEPEQGCRLLVAFGGSDPDNLTARAIDALGDPRLIGLTANVIVGPANIHGAELRARGTERIQVLIDPPDLPARMAISDFAVAGSGGMAWELAYLGVPMMLVANSPGTVVESLVRAGAACALGTKHSFRSSDMVTALLSLIPDCARRCSMASAGRNAVDGRGAARVSEFLDSTWQ